MESVIKNGKVMEELLGYLLENGYSNFKTSIEDKAEEVVFQVDVYTDDHRLHDKFKEDLFCCREDEFEKEEWKQISSLDCVCVLHNLGRLVDHYTITHEGDFCRITMYRKK